MCDARTGQRGDRQVQRGLAAGHGDGAAAAFERGDALFQHRVGGVADAAVHMARALHVEQAGGVFAALEDEAGAQVDRHRARAGGGVGGGAGVQRQRVETGVGVSGHGDLGWWGLRPLCAKHLGAPRRPARGCQVACVDADRVRMHHKLLQGQALPRPPGSRCRIPEISPTRRWPRSRHGATPRLWSPGLRLIGPRGPRVKGLLLLLLSWLAHCAARAVGAAMATAGTPAAGAERGAALRAPAQHGRRGGAARCTGCRPGSWVWRC